MVKGCRTCRESISGLFLKSQEPDLLDIHQPLAQAAEREKAGQRGRTRASNLQTVSPGGMEPGR
jgi:hypothetical protein